MRIVKREEINEPQFIEIFNKETHHEHEIIQEKNGIIRWKPNYELCKRLKNVNINRIIEDFLKAGATKNHECYRQFYRDIGYSLNGYWDIFYWEENNPEALEYIPNEK